MNRPNAIGFVLVGLVLISLPAVFPEWVRGAHRGGERIPELWLGVMGICLTMIGGLWLLGRLATTVMAPAGRALLGRLDERRAAAAEEASRSPAGRRVA